MKKLKILFTGVTGECIPPPYGGIPKRALMLGGFWKKSGAEVGYTFIYHHEKEDDFGTNGKYFFQYNKKPNKLSKIFFILKHLFKNPGLYFKFFSLYKKTYKKINRHTILYPAYAVFLNDVYNNFKPDVVVAETALTESFIALHLAQARKIPFVVEPYAEIHDKSLTKSYPFTDEERDKYWTDFLSLTDHIIASSKFCACGPEKYSTKEKISLVYATTLDVSRFDKDISSEEKRRLREKFKIPKDLFLVMAVGAFTHRKGHDHIIEAMAKIHKSHPKVGVVLCGAGEKDWLEELAKEKGVEKNVFFFQRVSEEGLTDLYHTVDLYCDASNTPRACLGIALTDALASRLPTLAYDVGGLPESVHHGENGYLVPLNDIEALGKAFAIMSEKTIEEKRELGLKGLALAKKIFDLPIIANQLLEILLTVVKNKNGNTR